MLHAVVMAGGSGTRFWPQSRRSLPKQFLPFGGSRTLLQETVDRCRRVIPKERLWIVTGETHAAETRRQVPELLETHLLREPCGRNTAPCIGLAALSLLAADPDAVMLVSPADHVIRPTEQFQQSVESAVAIIERDPSRLVLFGAKPTVPATGFGYIQKGLPLSDDSPALRVSSFREKPDVETAKEYLASGEFLWNCGLFVWRADAILREIEKHAPDLFAVLRRLQGAVNTDRWGATLQTEFPRMPSISIDYAVLEKSDRVCVIPAPFEWDDVGSWHALARLSELDAHNNAVAGRVCAVSSSGCIVHSSPDHLVATYGVHNLIVVHTPDATLVADKHDEAALRELLDELERRGLSSYL
jgi:mannose-1-phosphate guanylyltransferase